VTRCANDSCAEPMDLLDGSPGPDGALLCLTCIQQTPNANQPILRSETVRVWGGLR
jgi:hypothetical protein